jgi:hypothetical protein
MYIRVTLYCRHLIILWLCHLGKPCTVFVLICTVVDLYCFVVCMCGFCNDLGYLNLTEVFHTLTEVFRCFFLSCKANARVKLAFLDGARPALFHILFFF